MPDNFMEQSNPGISNGFNKHINKPRLIDFTSVNYYHLLLNYYHLINCTGNVNTMLLDRSSLQFPVYSKHLRSATRSIYYYYLLLLNNYKIKQLMQTIYLKQSYTYHTLNKNNKPSYFKNSRRWIFAPESILRFLGGTPHGFVTTLALLVGPLVLGSLLPDAEEPSDLAFRFLLLMKFLNLTKI